MPMKLTQKRFLKGTREFELVDDTLHVRIRSPFRKEKLTVTLSALDPDPVVNKPYLEFHDRDGTGPLLSLFLDRPDPDEFNNFVATIKQRVLEQLGAAAASADPEGLGANVFHEPPEVVESHQIRLRINAESVNPARIGEAIQLLQTYLAADEIRPLLSALEALKSDPRNEACLTQVANAFDELGPMQGAVLTYAPYLSILFSDDPFAD